MTDKTSVRDVEDVRITSEPHKQSLFGHDTDVSSIKNQIQAYGSKLPTLVCDFSFGCKLYLENCIHENISKRKEFINLNEHVKIETSSNIREYVARDTSSIKEEPRNKPNILTLENVEVTQKERRADALALRADERRDKLRKASGRSKYPSIRRFLNGETHLSRPQVSIRQSITYGREPGELKHLSTRRRRKKTRFPK